MFNTQLENQSGSRAPLFVLAVALVVAAIFALFYFFGREDSKPVSQIKDNSTSIATTVALCSTEVGLAFPDIWEPQRYLIVTFCNTPGDPSVVLVSRFRVDQLVDNFRYDVRDPEGQAGLADWYRRIADYLQQLSDEIRKLSKPPVRTVPV